MTFPTISGSHEGASRKEFFKEKKKDGSLGRYAFQPTSAPDFLPHPDPGTLKLELQAGLRGNRMEVRPMTTEEKGRGLSCPDDTVDPPDHSLHNLLLNFFYTSKK